MMQTVMILIGAATTAWALMQAITVLDTPDKKREPQSRANSSGTHVVG